MKSAYRMALALSLSALAATSVEAAPVTSPDDALENAVRVVNNYGEMIRVYAEDAEGRLHKLGRVARGELVEFELPGDVSGDAFRIKIYPANPRGRSTSTTSR